MDQRAQWQRVESILDRALDLNVEDREDFVRRQCAADEGLRDEVLSLLEAEDTPLSLLDQGVANVATPGARSSPVDFASAAASREELPIDQVGRYRILELLGRGGMGEVYLAEQTEPVRRRVAVKIVRSGPGSQELIARFEAERQALAVMEHPNIAQVLDGGVTDEGQPYLVMELVLGEPVTDYCDRRRLALRERLELFTVVCRAVQHAHHKAVVHRDLKPSNVLVISHEDQPVVKVIDFGIAKAMGEPLGDETSLTRHGQLVGTPFYMSPEQAGLGDGDVDTRSDVYSLGVLLYELLVGVLPLDKEQIGLGEHALLTSALWTQPLPRPSQRLSSLSVEQQRQAAELRGLERPALGRGLRRDLDWIVMKALERDRDRRYETPNALADDIERHLRVEPVLAGPPTTGYRMSKFVRRHRAAVSAAVVAVLALILGMVMTLFGLARANRAEVQAASEAAQARAISDFLQEMLASVDPRQAQGEVVTVRELIDQADQRLGEDNALDEQQDVEAAVRLTLGTTLSHLGEHASARRQLERSVELHRAAFGELDPKYATALDRLASLTRFESTDLETAEELGRRVLEIRLAHYGVTHLEVAGAHNNLGNTLADRGKNDEAEEHLQRALVIYRALLDEPDQQMLRTLNNLATLYGDMQRWEDAIRANEEALGARRLLLGEGSAEVSNSLNNLGFAYLGAGRFEEAGQRLREARELKRRIYGDQHAEVAVVELNLAGVHRAAGDLEGALEQVGRAAAMFQAIEMGDSYMMGGTLAFRGLCLLELGRLEQAEESLLAAYALYVEPFGLDHPRTRNLISRLVELYERTGQQQLANQWRARLGADG